MMKNIITEDRLKKCREERAALREPVYERLEKSLGKEAVKELRSLMDGYSEENYIWMAKLWDKEVGGFYYSNSARDNDGFLPDIESTVQVLRCADGVGLLSSLGGINKSLPDDIKKALLKFTKEMQSPDDGYFYHKQWGKNIKIHRRGRDLGWSVSLLRELGDIPFYDTPSGVKGSLGAPSSAAENKNSENSLAVCSEYLSSHSAFVEYLDTMDLKTQSYRCGNTLNALKREIMGAGEDYCKIFVDYMTERLRPDNGLFEEEVNYSSVSGLFKIGCVICEMGYPLPYIDKAFEGALKMALRPGTEGVGSVCMIHNCLVVLGFSLTVAKRFESEEKYLEMRKILAENAADLLRITNEKMKIFRRDDGAFSFMRTGSSWTSQGALVAVENTLESDVNASTIMMSGIVLPLMDLFGEKNFPLFGKEDGKLFIDLLKNADPIVKKQQIK